MCGINALIQFKYLYDCETLKHIVHNMNNQIVHRGPNHEGLFSDQHCALGMRRLSIIDIKGGMQPIWNEKRDKIIIFNGELYNYKSLRNLLQREGHVFSTNSDTEVVLHGFESYGISFLKQMEGMFAFVIYDIREKTWIVARDRIGEKPLYYYKDNKLCLIASELKSILSTGYVPKIIDMESLSQYFQLTYIPAPKSIIENVYKLEPATYMIIKQNGEIFSQEYWNLPSYHPNELLMDYSECQKKLREALFQSVEKRMISDVPLGAFLSGGIDSSIIVGIMSHISDKKINTFTIGYKEKKFDESNLAKCVSKKNNTNHHTLILDWNEIVKDIGDVLNNIDEPFADSSLIATYAVSRMTKQYVTVALTGDAGDELFAGYNKYLISYYSEKYKKIPNIIRKGLISPIVKKMPVNSFFTQKVNKVIKAADMDSFSQRKRMMCLGFKQDELKKLMKNKLIDNLDFIEEQFNYLSEMDEQTRAQYVDLKIVLEGDMLAKVDRASMLASLETRVPMLDTKVIELAYKMPSSFKINKRNKKIILKDTFKDMLPKEILSAPKHGFGVPVGYWLESTLRKNLMKYAEKEYIKRQGLFNYEYINEMIQAHFSHQENRYSELWAFFVFQNWYERIMQ